MGTSHGLRISRRPRATNRSDCVGQREREREREKERERERERERESLNLLVVAIAAEADRVAVAAVSNRRAFEVRQAALPVHGTRVCLERQRQTESDECVTCQRHPSASGCMSLRVRKEELIRSSRRLVRIVGTIHCDCALSQLQRRTTRLHSTRIV
eukprot:COSAG03_NODE_285_length_9412_cov_63.257597_6_plen_157_part_00